jgi:hypothetical protein
MEDLQAAGIERYSVQNETLNLSFMSRTLRPQEWNTPVLTLLQPSFTVVCKVLLAVTVFALLVLGAVALWRTRLLLLLPLWGLLITCAVYPWPAESAAGLSWGTATTTAIIPLLFAFLLSALAVYVKYNDAPRAQLLKKLFAKPESENANSAQANDAAGKAPMQGKKQIFLLSAISVFICAAVYFSLLLMPLYADVTGAQAVSLAAVAMNIHLSVCACILSVRFVLKRK